MGAVSELTTATVALPFAFTDFLFFGAGASSPRFLAFLFRFVDTVVIPVSLTEIVSSGLSDSAVRGSVSLALVFPLPIGLGLGRALGAGAG